MFTGLIEHVGRVGALDPIEGGYRLGRVDNTILRDAATNLPKIPGSSINGDSIAVGGGAKGSIHY